MRRIVVIAVVAGLAFFVARPTEAATPTSRQIATLQKQVVMLQKEIADIKFVIVGNGKPGVGVAKRLTEIEDSYVARVGKLEACVAELNFWAAGVSQFVPCP